MTMSVAIVIPTRDRSDLAIEAVRSVLALRDPRLSRVIVSNNGSDPEHVRRLAEFCERSADARLLHLRPPRPLAMAEHWDWAIGEALTASDVSHLALHYDRRVSRHDLALVFDAAALRPDLPVTYLLDVAYRPDSRFLVHQMPWSGGLYEIRTSRALDLASRGLLTDLWQAFPVLVNCLTPRSVLERVSDRFGSFCASTTPESCFGFRFCAVADAYLHFDRPLGIHYGAGRSNGLGYMRGERSGAFGDFRSLLGDRGWLDAAPLPGLNLGQNIFYHEYELVRREVGGDKFPPVEMQGYLRDLARGLCWIADPARQSEMRKVLAGHGWREEVSPLYLPAARPALPHRLRAGLERMRADYLAVRPDDLTTIGLKREDRALRCAHAYPRGRSPDDGFLAPLEPISLQ